MIECFMKEYYEMNEMFISVIFHDLTEFLARIDELLLLHFMILVTSCLKFPEKLQNKSCKIVCARLQSNTITVYNKVQFRIVISHFSKQQKSFILEICVVLFLQHPQKLCW